MSSNGDVSPEEKRLTERIERLQEENKGLKEQIAELERLKGVKWRGPWKR